MTRFDISTREWHELIKPVIPHASTDAELRNLSVIRIESAPWALYAVATDRYSLAAERHPLSYEYGRDGADPVHVRLSDAKASLALFPHSKDFDPPMRVTIDTVAVPVTVVGRETSIRRLAITLETGDGTRLVLHDQRDQSADPLAGWRDTLAAALSRNQETASPAMYLSATQIGRWSAACRKGERLAVCPGAKGADMVLIAVEQHFLAVWKPTALLESPAQLLAEGPWPSELAPTLGAQLLREGSGLGAVSVERHANGTTTTTIDVEPALFQQPAAADDEQPGGVPPWITASFGGICTGCETKIVEGDEIQADGDGGWLCRDCGTGDDDTETDGQ